MHLRRRGAPGARGGAIAAVIAGAVAGASCQGGKPSAAEITERAWRAHEQVVAAGEGAATCADAGAAMQRVFAAHRQAFVDGLTLDRDRRRLEQATAYLEENAGRYRDLEARMDALSERCADEPTVVAAFRMMESP